MTALQVRGRNVRSASDLGVCFYISQQFRKFVFASLPDPLKRSYYGQFSFENGCVPRALEILGKS